MPNGLEALLTVGRENRKEVTSGIQDREDGDENQIRGSEDREETDWSY